MVDVHGASTFQVSGDAYDSFMGRYSRELADVFGDYCLPAPEGRFLDVGCGPGALTGVAVARLGARSVAAVDPAPGFVQVCRHRHPDVDVRRAAAEELPFADDEFDSAAAQLVFHFVTDPARAVAEMRRVVRPGGVLAATVWDFAEGMQLLRAFWDAALALDSGAPDEAHVLRFGAPGELARVFTDGGLGEVEETTATVTSRYRDFDELWEGFLAGIGPAGAYAVARPPEDRDRLRTGLFDRLGRPSGEFTLTAVARMARARVPAGPPML
ncbi:MAG: class I SAM-dependent methyltransferase [Actinomycetes bacterium]